MRAGAIERTPIPLRQGSDWHHDSNLAALTILRADGVQRTWRNDGLAGEPLIDVWASTALDGDRRYCRLTMAGLAELRRR